MPVTPEVQTILDLLAAVDDVPIEEMTPQAMREAYAMLNATGSKAEMASVTDRTVPGPGGDIPVRVYVPTTEPGPRPVLVYFHGGGWVIGDLETHDSTVRALASGSGATVVSVDYRLAPEHPFPAPLDDCLAAVRWVADHGAEIDVDPARLAVAGDSAGGNLAAAVALALRDTGPALRAQVLVYPVTDGTLGEPSMDENGDGYFLTKATMAWFWDHYMGDRDRATEPAASVLHAPDEALAGLPPALVVTAEFDPLRDEGEAYASRLAAAGVDVTTSRYDGMIHGFFSMGDFVPEGKAAIDETSEMLRAALA
ncbi:MAG TPA: alpha/beta hydrolase [Acidimicrobiales bacterium]|jgi:acetyl esterase